MDEDTKKLLNDNLALNKENNQLLQKLVLYQKWNQIYKFIYWSIIILSVLGAFYFIKPYLTNLISVYTGGVGVSDIGKIGDIGKSLGNKSQIQDLLKSLNGE